MPNARLMDHGKDVRPTYAVLCVFRSQHVIRHASSNYIKHRYNRTTNTAHLRESRIIRAASVHSLDHQLFSSGTSTSPHHPFFAVALSCVFCHEYC